MYTLRAFFPRPWQQNMFSNSGVFFIILTGKNIISWCSFNLHFYWYEWGRTYFCDPLFHILCLFFYWKFGSLSHWFLGPLYTWEKFTFCWNMSIKYDFPLVIFWLCLYFGIKYPLMRLIFLFFFSNVYSILGYNLEDLPYSKIIKGLANVFL